MSNKKQVNKKISQLILASESAGRRDVLQEANINFQIDPAYIDERQYQAASIVELVEGLALVKAQAVATKYQHGIIVAADTMVVCHNKIIGKPKDQIEAAEILTTLSGQTHQVLTGLVVIDLDAKKTMQTHVTTNVTFRQLTAAEIDAYLLVGEYIGKAGAYSAQGKHSQFNFIQKIEGSLTNVIGLPLEKLLEFFAELGYKI